MKIHSWNIRTMYKTEKINKIAEIIIFKINIMDISEMRWPAIINILLRIMIFIIPEIKIISMFIESD